MAPKKHPKSKYDDNAWAWAENTDHEEFTAQHLSIAYRTVEKPCTLHHCRRNCKGNPRCVNALGEGKWFQEIKDQYWYGTDDPEKERKSDAMFVGLKNLGATCYVNTLLQVWFYNNTIRRVVFEWQEELDAKSLELLARPFIELRDSLKANELEELLNPKTVISHLQAVFALLQFGKRKNVDPTAFINCLGLDATSQQDAQEFSKLFMSLFEDSLPVNSPVRNFVQQEFLGHYQYITRCNGCQAVSKRPSQFYELDLNIKGHTTLIECIEEFLQEEKLEGDNQYACSSCASKQNAVRSISLQNLPPVLNLQLLRFVFDRKTGFKKKLSTFIEFSEVLDMTEYLKSKASVTYDLTAVLIHRGPSAYSGHYIAHIKDKHSRHWYKFNDEEIERMGGRSLELGVAEDLEGQECKRPKTSKGYHASRDAYTLVYERRPLETNGGAPAKPLKNEFKFDNLPVKMRRLVEFEDSKLDQWIAQRKEIKDMNVAEGKKRQAELRSLFEMLQWTKGDRFEWISTEWLVHWLSTDSSSKVTPVDNSLLLCQHDKIDPHKVPKAKVISPEAAQAIFETYKGGPRLTETSLCETCVLLRADNIRGRSRIAEDQKSLATYQKTKDIPTDLTQFYWVGKQSLRSWKKYAIENLDVAERVGNVDDSGNQPTAATQELYIGFNEDAQCAPHDQMVIEETERRLIPAHLWHRLKFYFPGAPEYHGDTVPCCLCTADLHDERHKKSLNVTLALEQRTQLNDLYLDRNRPNWSDQLNQIWVVSKKFIDEWKRFIKDPEKAGIPGSFFNTSLLCVHQCFPYEPATLFTSDCTKRLQYLHEHEWIALKRNVPVDMEISVSRIAEDSGHVTFIAFPDVCEACQKVQAECDDYELNNYKNALIFVRKFESVTGTTTNGRDKSEDMLNNGVKEDEDGTSWEPECVLDNAKRKLEVMESEGFDKALKSECLGRRKSSRTRRVPGENKVTVSATDTLRDLKIQIMEIYSVAPFDQTLTLNGTTLCDDKSTLFSLKVRPGDRLMLKVDESTVDPIFLEDPKDPEEGFKGTGLLGR